MGEDDGWGQERCRQSKHVLAAAAAGCSRMFHSNKCGGTYFRRCSLHNKALKLSQVSTFSGCFLFSQLLSSDLLF